MSMRKRLTAALLAAAVLTTALPAAAQMAEGGLHAGSLEVPVNKSQVVTADRSIAKALVGNPGIADCAECVDLDPLERLKDAEPMILVDDHIPDAQFRLADQTVGR